MEFESLNPRIVAMQPSATLAMTARAKERTRAGHPVIGLSAGEPDFDTPAPVAEAAIAAIREGFTHYTVNTGTPELREALAEKLLRDNGLQYDPADIVCSNGAKQSVAMAVTVLCQPEDEVLIPAPYWVSYPEMARFAGAEPVAIPSSVENGYRITPEQLEAAITPRSRVLMLCSPSNPTGSVYPREELEALADVLRRHPRIIVISDEIYEHIRYGVDHVSMASIPGMRDRVVTVNGFSKAYAMTGWRLGYLAAPVWIAKAAAKMQSQFTSAPSSISQRAGLAALQMDMAPVHAMRDSFRERRDFVQEAMAKLPEVRCPGPDGAFYLFPEVASYYGTSGRDGYKVDSSESLCFYLLEQFNVALVPGHAFGEPSGVRISYAASMENLAEAMRRIGDAFASLS